MKILYLANDSPSLRKGAAVRIQRTVATLRAMGHEVETQFATDGAEEGEGTNYLRRMLAWRARAASWLRDRRADLVQFRSIWEGVPAVAWARRHGTPAILEAHGFPSVELPYHHRALTRRPALLEKLVAEEQAVLAGSRLVMTPSRTGALFLLRRGVGADRIALVPNAVDTDLFAPPATPPPDAPPRRLVYSGTLAPWQGLSTLLEAMALVRSAPPFELHVVGTFKSAWRAALRREARRLRVHHLVHLSPAMDQRDLVPVLQTAHACVAPLADDARNALQGCCPIKLLEYMSAGRPVLATAIAPVEEVARHGESAHLVRPGSAIALADGLLWLAAHPVEREAMGARARETILAGWTSDRFQEHMAAALGRIR